MKGTRLVAVAALLVSGAIGEAPRAQQPTESAAFVAFDWRAKPGRLDAYNDYIRTVAVPIDEDGRRNGVFEELRTVTPGAGTTSNSKRGASNVMVVLESSLCRARRTGRTHQNAGQRGRKGDAALTHAYG